MTVDNILKVAERQIKNLSKKIDKSDINDPKLYSEFTKLMNVYNRLLVTANKLEECEDHTFDFMGA
jgi:hypothetical protein